MSPLVRRTTLVVVALALAVSGCGGAKKKAATPAPTSAPASTPSAAPTSASPTPAATESPAPPAPEAIAAAKKLLVTGKQFEKGWDNEVAEELEPDQEDDEFCANEKVGDRPRELFSVTSDVTKGGSQETSFQHEVAVFAPGAAQAAVDAVDTVLKECAPTEQDGAKIEAKSTGAGKADITFTIGDLKLFGAFRYEARGDYINSVIATDKTTAGARKLADRAMKVAQANFTKAGL